MTLNPISNELRVFLCPKSMRGEKSGNNRKENNSIKTFNILTFLL